jgi:c-di-GMP-binding flagellar brake protein YcgR
VGEEKRRYVRWKKKIRITYSLWDNPESYQEIFTEDFSETGLQILSADKWEPQQIVRLKLEFVYDSVPIVSDARVMHVKAFEKQYRMGLEFINMDDFQKQRLKRCLDKVRQDFRDEATEDR